MKRLLACFLILVLTLGLFAGCNGRATLNGVPLKKYTIVYSADAPDYCQRAAEYIQKEIESRTKVKLSVAEAGSGNWEHEIVVGETDRAISTKLNADTKNLEFAILADDNHIAMEGDYFIIAAAAYFFVDTYITGNAFESNVPKEVSIHEPIVKETENIIFLIGDGMGFNHTKLIGWDGISHQYMTSDNESVFYGEYFPYKGKVHTDSLSGVTDSAAAATALATGYKTINGYVGLDGNEQEVQSLTELASTLGMMTAVMSTEAATGATPAGFSAHANSRNTSKVIEASQEQTVEKYGTIINCSVGTNHPVFEKKITDTLSQLDAAENGFFLMYEEAHIDKMSHDNNLASACKMVLRFNQAIGLFMEYAFYHPGTLVLITADHETGGLTIQEDGSFVYTQKDHTGQDVPIYAFGQGAEVFHGFEDENTTIPKIIAGWWGKNDFGQQ